MRFLRFALLCLCAFATPAVAADFRTVITDDDGKPMCWVAEKDGNCLRQFTLGQAVRNAFDAQANQSGVSAEEKNRRGELGQSLIGATQPKLLDSDVATIKTAIGNAYPPSIVHKIWKLLDGKDAAETEKK